MLNRLVEWTVRFNQRSFIKITRQTLMLLFPIAYVGTLAVMLKKAFFATDSFFFNVADLGDIMPGFGLVLRGSRAVWPRLRLGCLA